MAVTSQVDNFTAPGASTALQPQSQKQARVTLTGTYTAAVGDYQGSNDGTNFVNLSGVREDTGAAFNPGADSIGSTNFSVIYNIGGWSYVRFNVTAVTVTGSNQLTVTHSLGANYLLPLGVTPISLTAVGQTISSSSANALVIGPNGTTNPTLNVDASTASAATGLNVKSAAAGAGLAISVISSGTNENLTVNAKGSGTITIGAVSTGNIVLGTSGHTLTINNASGAATFAAGGVTLTAGNLLLSSGTGTITSNSAVAFGVGPNGATNPAFNVDGSTSSAATGLNVKSAAAAAGLALSVISSGTNEALTLDAKGSGTITIAGTSTGNVICGTGLTSKHATAGLGYSTGAGGAVTQITGRTTGVTLNTTTGAITLVSAAGSATPASFTVTNSAVAATDTVIVSQKSGTDLYEVFVTAVAAGSFKITSFTTGGTTTEQPVFNFAVIKGVTS